MATIEVQDGRGRVEFVTLSRDRTVLFGSSPKCEIVLDDPAILPFHGRIRWKENRYKVDASPEAQFLLVNGRKMVSSSFLKGDEIRLGPCRLLMADDEEDLPRDDKTRVQPPPALNKPRRAAAGPVADEKTVIQPPPAAAVVPSRRDRERDRDRERAFPSQKDLLEANDWEVDLTGPPPDSLRRVARDAGTEADADADSRAETAARGAAPVVVGPPARLSGR